MFKSAFMMKAIVLVALFALAACSAIPVPQSSASTLPTAAPQSTDTLQPLASPTATAPGTSPTPVSASATQAAVPAAATPSAGSPAAATATPAASSSLPAGEIQFNLVADKSSADYRVREQLARLSFPSDAVGKTSQISGSIAVKADGTIDSPASKITVDVSTLQSDSGMRDGYVARSILQSNQFKDVVFVPTSESGLTWPLPQSGKVAFKVTGNLTVKDVTKPVTWDVTGTIQNGVATGNATTSFTFEDFNLSQPSVPVVLNVVDHIALEVSVTFQQAGQ